MSMAAKLLRWIGVALTALVFVFAAVFGFAQTEPGRALLARTVARAIGDPDFTIGIEGLGGIVPFRVRIEQIDVGDRDGTYLTAQHVGIEISPAALLAGRIHMRSLGIAKLDWTRLTTAPSTMRLLDYLRVPHLPVRIALDRLSIGKLTLAPPVLGEGIAAKVDGSARLADGMAHIALDLQRIDDAGSLALAMDLAGDPPILKLRLEADEPTGVLSDRLLGRTDHLALALSVDGKGAVADWHGRLQASAGPLARLDADLTLATSEKTALGLSGSAVVTPLIPTELVPLAGNRVGFSLRATFGDRISVDQVSIETVAGNLAGDAVFGDGGETITAHLRANVPNLSVLSGLIGLPIKGSVIVNTSVAGTAERPNLELSLSASDLLLASSGAEHLEADVRANPAGDIGNPDTRIELTAGGRIEGLVIPKEIAWPPELGRDVDWSLDATASRNGRNVDLTRLSAEGAGAALTGSGQITEAGAVEGQLDLSIADLRPLSELLGYPLAGSVVGGSATMTGFFHRTTSGVLALEQVAVSTPSLRLSGDAQFDPASNSLAAGISLDLPRLKPLGAALGTDVDGAIVAHFDLDGPLEQLQLRGNLDATNLAAEGLKLDRLQLAARIADLSERKAAIDGSFRGYGLDGNIALAAQQPRERSDLILPFLKFAAAGSTVEGSLRIALDSGLVRGSLAGRAPDLARWSKLAGTALSGTIEFSAGLDARKGQLLDLSVTGTKLMAGAGSSRLAAGRLALVAHFADILRAPLGTARLSLTSAGFGAGEFDAATLIVDAPRPRSFVFRGDAKGRPLTITLSGEGSLEPDRFDLRMSRLAGSLGKDRIFLEQPLTLSKRGSDLSFSGLALDFGTGRIAGNGGVRGEALSLAISASNLPIASGAKLLGYPDMHGFLTLATTIGGTLRAPQGRFSATARDFTFASRKRSQAASLGLAVGGNWNGRNIDLNGRITGLSGDQIALGGSMPLVLTPAPISISIPTEGRLALQVNGSGQLEHLADLLPLGEDRVSGRFAADVAVGGTVGSPAASGRLLLSDARYENFASGAVLNNLRADIVGDRDRFTLAEFSASDKASGTLRARGNVTLRGSSGPIADLSATLDNFRVAARDEVVATASGTVSIAGPLTSPRVAAPLTVNRADITLPQALPPTVVVLKVVERNGKTGGRPPIVDQGPALPAVLDLTLDMPGNIFVRGHGLESEWRGRLRITGTSAAPIITGSLQQIRGSVDLLGKTFTLTRGAITFDGSAKLDPILDIVAEASAADVTAQVTIAGFASAPTVTLSSTPPLPQDEILARVLFNRGVGQITAGEGLQLAAAAGTLTGHGLDVLDRLRGGLGLDWFRLGSAPAGPASTSLNPRATNGGAANGAALSAGKYLVPGVSVGVTQGLSPPTSKITVDIELRPHLTLQGEAGQSGSTGIGLNYNYDY